MTKNQQPAAELNQIAKGASINFLGSASRNLLGFLFVYVLARKLTAEEMGLFFLAINIITFVSIIALGGLDSGLRRFVSIAHGQNDTTSVWCYVLTAFKYAVPVNIFIALGIYSLSDILANNLFSKPDLSFILKGLAPFIVFYSLAELFSSITQAYKYMQYRVIGIDITNNVLRIGLFLTLATFLQVRLLRSGIIGYVLAMAVSMIIVYYYFDKIIPKMPRGKINGEFRRLLSFSFPEAISRAVTGSSGLIEIMLLGYFVTSDQVGIYAVALKVAIMGTIILSSFNTMFSPMISQLHNEKRIGELNALYACTTRWILAISLPIYVFIAWFAVSICSYFGENYVFGAGCIVILCVGQITNAATGPSGIVLLMSGHSIANLVTNLMGFFVSIIFNIILIPLYGILGCAISVCISIILVNISRVLLVRYYLNIQPYNYSYLKLFIALASMLAGLNMLEPSISSRTDLGTMLAKGFVVFIIYVCTMVALRLDENDRFVLEKVKKNLSR